MQKIKSIGEYFFSIYKLLLLGFKTSYFKSSFYNKKISINLPSKFNYKPRLYIINSLISFGKKKIKVEDYSLNTLWKLNSKNKLEFQNLHSFLWLSFLDLKTNKMSIIFVSHDINVINHMSDYIYVLKDGVIYDEFGNFRNSNNLKPYTRQLISNSF